MDDCVGGDPGNPLVFQLVNTQKDLYLEVIHIKITFKSQVYFIKPPLKGTDNELQSR